METKASHLLNPVDLKCAEYKHRQPTINNLAAIFRAMREKLQLSFQVHSVAA